VLGAWQMPDLLIFTGSVAANAVVVMSRLVTSLITIAFIIKQYHNEISTRGLKMKKFLIFVTCVLSTGTFAQQSNNWENSPNNWNNSPNNWNNSQNNWDNSPNNWNNSPNNYNSQNGVYDSQGNRQGYQVQSPSGVINYYDNRGNRTGYAPRQ